MQDRKRKKLQVGQYMINDNLFSTSLKKLNYEPRAKEILRASKFFFYLQATQWPRNLEAQGTSKSVGEGRIKERENL